MSLYSRERFLVEKLDGKHSQAPADAFYAGQWIMKQEIIKLIHNKWINGDGVTPSISSCALEIAYAIDHLMTTKIFNYPVLGVTEHE
jgi:hypothetical protein